MQRDVTYYSPHNQKMIRVRLVEANKFWRLFFKVSGFGGITLPNRKVVLMPHYMHDESLITHELMHVEQYERLGNMKFLWRYFVLLLRHGYKNHPMEIEARQYALRPKHGTR